MRRVLVVQHVPHEGLGTFEAGFNGAGCAITSLNAADAKAAWPRLSDIQGLVILGGPMGVYEQDKHPFLTRELEFIRQALSEGLPILGVCLGAQLLANALGAEVRKNHAKEIGWYPLRKEPAAANDPLLAAFEPTETVFQWHGDTFALPHGAVQLASSPLCAQQAFRYREHVYGLQFHVEVTAAIIAQWLGVPENAAELQGLRGTIDPAAIRRQTPQQLPRLQELSQHVASEWCRFVRTRETLAR